MAIHCYLCGRRQRKGLLEPAMHRFPKNNQLRELWLKACGLSKRDDVSTIKICSAHFTPQDYLEPLSKFLGNHLRLKPGVVPSVRVPNNLTAFLNAEKIDVGLVEEVVETADPDGDDLEDIPLINDVIIENIVPDNSSDGSSAIHQDHLYSTPLPEEKTENRCKRRFGEPRFVSEVELYDLTNPKTGNRTLKMIKTKHREQGVKIKALQSKVLRLQKRLDHFKGALAREREEKVEREKRDITDLLPENIKDILIRKRIHGAYSNELKEFTLTLHSCSPKAYNCVRKFWDKLLPHPSTVREWQKEQNKSVEIAKEIHAPEEIFAGDMIVKEEITLYPDDVVDDEEELKVICRQNGLHVLTLDKTGKVAEFGENLIN